MRIPRPALAAAVALLLLGGVLSSSHVSRRTSPTWDEVHFFGIGSYLITEGRFDIPGVGIHPPLAHYLSALPLLGESIPRRAYEVQGPGEHLGRAHLVRGDRIFAQLGFEGFCRARLPFIGLYALLGLLVFSWSRWRFGDLAGLFSLALYLSSPTLLANGLLITNDLTLAVTLVAALYGLQRSLEEPTLGTLMAFAFTAALAPAAKLTGLLLAPLAMLTVLHHALRGERLQVYHPGRGRQTVDQGRFLLVWALIGLLTLLLTYLTLVALYQGQWDLKSYRTMIELVSGLYERGHPVYLDGQSSFAGFAHYYARTALYKTPMALLLAVALGFALPRGRFGPRPFSLLALAGAYVGVLSALRYTLGLRYILVSYPLLLIAAGRLLHGRSEPVAGEQASQGSGRWRTWLPQGIALGLLVGTIIELATVYPHPLRYTNPLLARRAKHHHLADMDLDWGGGLLALRRYLRGRPSEPYALSYHGSLHPRRFGLHPAWYENPSSRRPSEGTLPARGLFFASSTNISGLYGGVDLSTLRTQKPLAILGATIYVYRICQLQRSCEPSPGARAP